jgi:ABC-type spermidine/putrescine transport system permease subunit I
MSAVITVLVLITAYPFSYFLARYTSKWQKFLLLLVVISFWTSGLLRTYAWMTILGEKGLINTLLLWTGIVNKPLGFLVFSRFNVIVVGAYFLFPFAVLTLYTSLEKMDFDLVRAAMDLGATPARAFWHITIPQTLPGIFTAIIFVFIPSLGFYIVPALVGGTTSAMMANLVGSLFRGGLLGMGAASSFVVAVFIGFVLTMTWRHLQFEKLYRI